MRLARDATVARTQRFVGSGGTVLTADTWGHASSPPLVLLHGGGQTRGAWGQAGARLAELGWRVIAPDARGHGDSEWSVDGVYDPDVFADDIRAIASALGEPPVLVGASLGGLSALLAAGEDPRSIVRALVLVDVAHRANPLGVDRILDFMSARPDGFGNTHEAAAAIAQYLPHRGRPDHLEGLRRNLRWRGDRLVWHWDPRLLDRVRDRLGLPGGPERYLEAARCAEVPILLVRGGISDVVSEDITEEFCTAVPMARQVAVPDAGHMVAGDRNERFIDATTQFLAGLKPVG